MMRSHRLMYVIPPTLVALGFWVTNAGVVGRHLAEPGMIRAFFWNSLLFAVVVTGVNAATIAWTSNRTRVWSGLRALGGEAGGEGGERGSEGVTARAAGKLVLGSIVTAVGFALVALALGLGISALVIRSGGAGDAPALFGQSVSVLAPLGVVFAVLGAVAGDLGANIRSMLAEKPAAGVALGLVVLLVASHLLWAGAAWLAVIATRGHMPGA